MRHVWDGLWLQLIEHFVSSVMISSWNNASCDFFVALFNLLGLLSLKPLIVASFVVTIQILRSSCQWSSDHLILTSGSFRGIHITYPTILNSSLTTEYNVPLFRNNYCLGDPVITYFYNLVITQEPWNADWSFPIAWQTINYVGRSALRNIRFYQRHSNPHDGGQLENKDWTLDWNLNCTL